MEAGIAFGAMMLEADPSDSTIPVCTCRPDSLYGLLQTRPCCSLSQDTFYRADAASRRSAGSESVAVHNRPVAPGAYAGESSSGALTRTVACVASGSVSVFAGSAPRSRSDLENHCSW